jgi:hypothetical protein
MKNFRWIDSEIDGGEWEEIRQATQGDRPIRREAFQKQVSATTGRLIVAEKFRR